MISVRKEIAAEKIALTRNQHYGVLSGSWYIGDKEELIALEVPEPKKPKDTAMCPDCGYEYKVSKMITQCDENGDDELVCKRCSSVRDSIL